MRITWMLHADRKGKIVADVRIDVTADTALQADKDPADLRFLRTIMTDAYQERGHRDPSWDHRMLDILAELERRYQQRAGFKEKQELSRQCALLRTTGCDDALLHFAAICAVDFARLTPRTRTSLERVIARLDEQDYSPLLKCVALMKLAVAERSQNAAEAAEQHDTQAVDAFFDWLEHHPEQWRGDGQQQLIFMARTLAGVADESEAAFARSDAFAARLAAVEGIEPWLATFIRGEVAMGKAWVYRGGGPAREIDEQRSELYRQHIDEARPLLTEANRLAPDQPEPACDMIRICWGGLNAVDPQRHPHYWFTKAVRAQFDYMLAYTSYAFTLLPRWGGTHETSVEFARQCAATQRFDTPVPYYALEILCRLALRDFDRNLGALRRFDVFPMIQTVLQAYVDREQDPRRRHQYRSELLLWCYLHDQPAARGTWSADAPPFDRTVLDLYRYKSVQDFGDREIDILLARGGPAGALIDKALATSEGAKAAKLFAEALTASPNDPWTQRLAATMATVTPWQQTFDDGQWVDLTFNDSLSGWTPVHGQWTGIDDRTVEAVTDASGLRMFLDLNTGRRFEVEMTIEFIHKALPRNFNAGICFAHRHEYPGVFRKILLSKDDQALYVSSQSNIPTRIGDAAIDQAAHLRVQVDGENAKVHVNGQALYDDVWLKDRAYFEKEQELAIGGNYLGVDGYVVRFSNLRIMKRQNEPVPSQPK